MEQILKIKCPHCGWVRSMDIQAYEDTGAATVTRGVGDDLRQATVKIKEWLSKSNLDNANAWLDMPACPHCKKTYRYNARTREVKA